MCLLKTDPVFSVPSWSFFFSWIENQIRHWLCPVLSVSVVWGGFTFWESNLEVFSQCPFPTVLIQTLSERLRNGEFDWILTTFLSFLDSRRRGHSIFFCSNMWRLHVKNRHLFSTSYSSAKEWWIYTQSNTTIMTHPNPTIPGAKDWWNTHAEHAEQPAARFTPAEPNLSRMWGWKTSLIEISSRYKQSIYICICLYIYRDSVLCWKKRL